MKKEKMHLSDEGFEFLKTLEHCHYTPRMDSNGVYTVGYRHQSEDLNPEREYTTEEILAFFEEDKKFYEDDVNLIYDPVFMNQQMFDACFAFAFSAGGISSTELGRMIKSNPFDDRIRDFWRYTYTQAKKNKALVMRRIKEVNYYFK
jgi:GH24 family phage-related lysozyme (muramidase)